MATRKEIAQNQKILYDDAVANNMFQAAVPTFKEFQKRLEGQGYQKMVYDNYKKHNVKGKGFNNLNEFRGAFGGSFYADENKIGVSGRAAAISASAQQTMNNAGRYNRLKQRKQKQQKDFGRVNLGTHQTPYGGDANYVVKDDFAYNPETGKTGAYVTSDNENVYSLPEAEQSQAQDVAYRNAVDTGEIPSVLDVRDQNGNYDLQENIGKNGTYLTEEGAQKQFDKKLEDAYARKKEIESAIAEDHRLHGNPLLSYGASIGASNGRTAEQSDYSNKLATSLALVKQQIGALEAVKQYPTSSWGEDALKALDNTAFTAKTWDFGLTDFATMGQMERIKTKMDNNIPLSGSDKMLLKSKLGADAATALEDEKMGNVYRWTKIAGQSLPFMADFFLTGGYGGITKGISRGALKFAAKRGMGKVSAAILKNTGIVAGDVIGSYAMAGTEQALKTGADIMQRHLGNLYQDEKGDYKFGTFDENGNLLHEGGESIGTALYKGMTSAMVENYTEKLFGHNYGIKNGAANFMEKHGMNASAEFFKNIGKSGWYTNSKKWMEKFGINGFAEEVMEEEIGIPLHALLDGEGKVSDLLDAKQQLDIIGGMAISVGSMYAMGAGSRPVKGIYNRAQYYRFRNKVNVADSDAQNLMGDNWADIKDKIDNATNEQMGSVLADILRQRDTMTKEQINAAVNYGVNLMKMRGYNIAKTAEMNAKEITNEPTTPEEQHQADIDNAYSEGHDADDTDKHDIQIQQEDQMKTLATALGISEQQLSAMSDEELESLTGQDDKLDQAIYDYQLSSARYQGVVDDAQDKVDLAAHQAEQRVDRYTDQSRGSVRNATIKASGGLEDYGVYIISGNIATHDDGSIDVSNSDDMILYYDPTTNSVEHADALMFAELGEELHADDVKAQAVSDAKENAIKEVAGIIDGTVEVGSQFNVTDTDGTEHTYEVLADYGDGTAAISIDGNVVENPYSLADLQQMKDLEDQKRLEAAKDEREQMEKERAAQQNQETEQTQPSFDFNQILNDNGNVVLVDVLDKDGNTKYPDSRLFLIRDAGAKAKVVELKSDGTIVPHAVNKEDVATISSMSLDEYKQAMAESSMTEDNRGENRGEIEVETPTIEGETTAPAEETAAPESAETPATEQTPAAPAITLEDGTIVPMLEDGNPDFSKLTAAQTAELYDTQFGEDADSIVSGYVSDAKKALDKASNMTVKGKTFVEQKAAKDAKEKAIADAQAAYDSAIAIRDAYNERQLAKVEDTAEGRKELIEKARRKFARLKSAVKDDAEAVSQLYRETIGSLLHRLYDGTGIDVTDTTPLTAEEYVASNLGAHSLNYEGTETSKGVKQETGLSREDFAKTQLLAADGKGTTIDALVHSLWENRPSNLESLDTQDIRNALIGVLNSGFKASEARNFVENIRIAQAENILEEQKRAQENAAYAEQPEAESEAELKAKSDEKAELKAKSEAKLDNESDNESNDLSNETDNEQKNDNINDNINVPEDATDEAPLGAERDESDLPFSAKENGKQQTTAERAADVEKNKVDDMKVVDNIVGQKTRKAFERLAKMMGANIQWQYSDKLGNGWIQETTDADGNVHRTIFITLDSSITEGAQFIFGHEMTHQIKNLNPAAYNELTQLVLDTYGSDAFDKAVDETMQRYSDAGFSGRARDYYAEEVVADAVGEMIRDLNLAHTLAMKMSHPLLAAIHEILQKIRLAFFGTEYSDVTKNIIRSIEQAYVKTANGEVTNTETGEDVSFSLRQKPEPKKKGIGYKVFVLKDGKLYPPMVANPDGAATPVGVWLDADAAPIAGESKTGRPQVKQGGKGTQGGSGKLAYRPGWHLGIVPYAIQFNRKDAEGNKTLFPKNFVFAEVEYAADVDYQEEARQEGINPSGKYQHSLAGLKHLPTDGYYMYRTNPNPETDPWVITGAMKVNRILTRAEQAELVKNAGREPQQIQDGDIVTDDVVNSINQEIAAAPKFSLKTYHGTGANFDRFDTSHAYEGAGSETFGHGIYVTKSAKIGASYALKAKVKKIKTPKAFKAIKNGDNWFGIFIDNAVRSSFAKSKKETFNRMDELIKEDENIVNDDTKPEWEKNAAQKELADFDKLKSLFEGLTEEDIPSLKRAKANRYEVEIPDDTGNNYLDWNKPMNKEQKKIVREGLEKLGVDVDRLVRNGYSLDKNFGDVYNGLLYYALNGTKFEERDSFVASSNFLSSLGFTGIKYYAGTIWGGAKKGDLNYVIFNEDDAKIVGNTKFSLKKVNDAFNQRLDELVKNPNQKDKILHLGRSSSFLKAGGIADADIESEFDKFVRKSGDKYKNNHPFNASDLKNLPMAIAEPIAVFKSTNANDHVVLTELQKDGKNFIVAIRAVEQHRKGGVVLEVNQITSLYPKEEKGIINWVNTGRISNVDKEKALHFIEALQPHAGTSITDEELKSAANIINSFETTKENGEKFSLKDEKIKSVAEKFGVNESALVIKNALDAIKNGEKDVKVKVYRAVPTSVKEGKLRNGDWVTPSKKYAEMHGDNRLEGKYRIIEDEVPANQLWWDGNDANEFGFDDGKEYRYKNAKNNRKLNDLITYDNKGNVIPPSKRFNSRKNDIRFSLAGERGAADMAEDLKSLNTPDEVDDAIKTAIEDMPRGWKMANKKMIHIAQALGENRKAEIAGEEPKFSLKDGTLIKAGTYFSGGGLVEEGLKGIIDPVVAVEYDEKISGVYRNNFGQHIVTADVRDVDPKELVKQIDGEVEYFHASPVCKNYSQAKSNHAEVELDKETAASTAEFINAIKPKVVTIENVKGYKDSEAMKTITDALDANGYTWDADVYNAADYGGYTNRERLIVRAVRDGKLPAKPEKMARKSGWYEAVADIIPTLTEKKNGVANWMDVRLKADGIDWRNIDKPLYVMGSAYADGKIPHAFADELLPTLRTKSGDVIVMPDGKVYRAMGRVLARVSGVSDDYKMPFSENLSHIIIGNGIPTQLTEHVIAPLLTGSDPKFSIRTYHGTGASFDKFDSSHMGEGEGSQAFGWGGYVTNSKDIAEDYTRRAKIRKDNGGFEFVTDMSANNKDMVRQYIYKYKDVNKGLDAMRKDLSSALEMFPNDKDLKELSDILEKKNEEIAVPDNIAYLYDVDIPDDNGDYLDWDAPLTDKQKNTIIKELRRLKIDFADFKKRGFSFDGSFGGNAYDFLMYALRKTKKWKDVNASRAVSKFLSSIGFTGIKYKAGTIFGGAKEGDYNYVIFDENNANIVGNTRFSLRYDKFEHDLNQWKKDNNLPKDAQRPTIPQRNAGESAVDFLRRVDEYRKQMALWKTAPTYEQHLLSDDTALGEFNRELQRGSVLKRIAFQDSMLAIRKAQEAIMKEVGVDRLNMAEDAYTAENRSHGKGKNEFEEYNNEFLQPLRKAYHQMKKVLGDSYDNVRIYMMAKHGLERDAQMAFKKSLEADYEDVAQRSAAYKAYKGDMNRIINDSDLEFGRVDYNTWRQRDNALRVKYSPSYMDYRYDENGIAYDYSGLSALFGGSDFEEAAHKLVRDIESSHVDEVQDLWDATNAATKKILRDGYKAGMMSKDTYQYVRDMYSHYIPLRGWDGTTADQVWDYIGGGKGAFNQTLKKAHGRTSIADDPIAYIENMAESGILLNNKNWVKQHLMLLAQNHPTSLLTLSKAWYVKSTDANGNEEWIPATPQITSQMDSNQVKAAIDAFEKKMELMAQTGDATQKRDGLNIAYPQTHSEEREHEVRVMKDGEEYVIYVNGDPQLAQAMNNTRAHRVSEGIKNSISKRVIAVVGRKMAAAYTSLSPLFIPSNYFRDLTMTMASTAIREDAKYNYLLIKNLATSWNLGFMLRDFQNGKLRDKVNNGNATPKEQMFYDFMMNGGETGFVSSLDVEDLKKKFKNDLKDLDRWKANPVKVGHTIMDSIEFLNRMIEDSNRFAVYMTSIQYGRSIDEAVNDAKDVTLNFNRKGTGEHSWQTIRNLYLFINPAVQSLQTLGALAKHHPFKFTAVTASWIASGVLVPIVNAALMQMAAAFLGGDGDDDKDWYKDISKKYWQFSKWDRRNNFIMWVPTTHEFVKIPLAQEFRAFYGLGDMIASKMMGGELAEESWEDYGWDLVGQVVDMLPLDPTGYDGNIAVSLMPNAIRPVFELASNVDFTGKPLFKDTEYNKYDPNFTKAYVGTPDWLVRASRMVNSIGNDYPDVQQNSIDAFGDPRYNLNNPAVVDHVLSSYLGGAYTMGSQVLGLLTKSLNDPKEIKVADIPLFSKFVSNPYDRPVTKKQGDEFWNMKENHDRAANTLSKLKKQAKVDGDYSMLERFYGSEEYKKYKQDDVKVKKYEEDKKKERAEDSGEEYRPHKLNAEDIYKAHATPKDDFEDLKLKQLYTKLNGFKTSYDLLVDTAPSQSDGYYNNNKAAIDAIDEISLDKQEISELKKGFLDDGKDAYNAEDMKQIRDLRKKILSVLEKANKVVVANQKAKAKK